MKNIYMTFVLAMGYGPVSEAAIDCAFLQEKNWGFYVRDFGIQWDDKKLDCDQPELKFAQALYSLHDIKWKEINKGVDEDWFYDYAKKRIDETTYDEDCTSIANFGGGRMSLCEKYYLQNEANRASTIIHEARHDDVADPGHVDCTKIKKKNGCDEKFNWRNGSGYNYDVYFLYSLYKNSDSHELDKMVIKSEIRSLVPNRFNEISDEDAKKYRL